MATWIRTGGNSNVFFTGFDGLPTDSARVAWSGDSEGCECAAGVAASKF
jgi:hypothetical protein